MLNMKGMIAKLFSAALALGMVIQPVTPLTSPIIVFAQDGEVDPNPKTSPAPSGSPDARNTPEASATPSPTPSETPEPLIATYEDGVITISRSEEEKDFNISEFFDDHELQLKATVTEYTVDGVPNPSAEKTVSFTEDGNNGKASADITGLVDGLVYATISNISISVTPDNPNLSIENLIDLSALENEELKEIVVDKRTTTGTFAVSKTNGYSFSATVSNPKNGYRYSLRLKNNHDDVVVTSEPVECTNPFGTLTLSLNSGFAFDTEYTPVIVSEEEGEIVTGTTPLSIASPKYENISWMNDADSGKKYAEVIFNEEVFGTVALTLNQTANGEPNYVDITGSKNENSTTLNSYLFELTDVSGQDTSLDSYGAGTTYSFYGDDNKTPAVKVVLTAYDGYDYEVGGSENAYVSSAPSFIDIVAPVVTDFDLSVGENTIDDNATVNSDVTLSVKFNEPVDLDTTESWYEVTTASGETATEDTAAVLTRSSDGRTYTAKFSGNETDLTGLIYTIGSFTVKDGSSLSGTATINKTFTIDKVNPTVKVENTGNLNDGFVKGNINFTVSTNEVLAGPLTVGYTYTTNAGDDTASKTFEANADGAYSVVLGDEAANSVITYKNITLSGKDKAGNEINVDPDILTDKEITVDNAKPSVVFDDLKVYNAAGEEVENADNIANGKAVYTVLISDAGSGIDEDLFVFQIDGNEIKPSDYQISDDGNGNYTVTIEAPAQAVRPPRQNLSEAGKTHSSRPEGCFRTVVPDRPARCLFHAFWPGRQGPETPRST